MKRLILSLTVLIIGVSATALPQAASATPLENWPALLDCADVNADGRVNIIDIGTIVLVFGTNHHSDDYIFLYDLNTGEVGLADGFINIIDIGWAVLDFGRVCSLTNTQVAQATLSMAGKYGGPDLRDPQNALDAGYIKSSQLVPDMGIHLFNQTYMTTYPACCGLGLPGEETESQLIHPVGLVYTADASGPFGLGELIGAWYIQPNDVVCGFYGIEPPCQSDTVQPIGFGELNTDEDNFDPDGGGRQGGWHDHDGLCVWNWGEENAAVAEDVSQEHCEPSGIWFSTYGWMIHLYNFLPNPEGRFQKWNDNVPFP